MDLGLLPSVYKQHDAENPSFKNHEDHLQTRDSTMSCHAVSGHHGRQKFKAKTTKKSSLLSCHNCAIQRPVKNTKVEGGRTLRPLSLSLALSGSLSLAAPSLAPSLARSFALSLLSLSLSLSLAFSRSHSPMSSPCLFEWQACCQKRTTCLASSCAYARRQRNARPTQTLAKVPAKICTDTCMQGLYTFDMSEASDTSKKPRSVKNKQNKWSHTWYGHSAVMVVSALLLSASTPMYMALTPGCTPRN